MLKRLTNDDKNGYYDILIKQLNQKRFGEDIESIIDTYILSKFRSYFSDSGKYLMRQY